MKLKKFNKHTDIVGRASLNTIHLFTGLCISFVTWFLLLLQPQMLLSDLFSCVSHPGNKHYTTPVKSIPHHHHSTLKFLTLKIRLPYIYAGRERNLGYLALLTKLPGEGHAVSPLLKNGIFLLLYSKPAVRFWLILHHQAALSSSKY